MNSEVYKSLPSIGDTKIHTIRPLYYELLIVHIYNHKSVMYCYTLHTLVRKCPVAVTQRLTPVGLTTIHYRIAGETIPQLAVVP